MTETSPEPVPVTYVSGRSAVDVLLPSGRAITVARGESIDVDPSDAAALLALPGWEEGAVQSLPFTSSEESSE